MDSMEINKGIAAVLIAGIAFFLFGSIGVNLVREEPLEKSAIQIATPQPAAPAAKPAEPALPPSRRCWRRPIRPPVRRMRRRCAAFAIPSPKAAKPIVGPNLYNVVGGPHAHMQGFDYSNALKGKTGPWTFAELNEWLHKPSAYAPGTRMGFAGIANDQDRANVIDYLRTLSPNPLPLPNPAEAPAPAAPAAPGATAAAPPPPPNRRSARCWRQQIRRRVRRIRRRSAASHAIPSMRAGRRVSGRTCTGSSVRRTGIWKASTTLPR